MDLSQAEGAVEVDLAAGIVGSSTATGFENVTGTVGNDEISGNDQDNVIRGGSGNDIRSGGDGADAFVFFEQDIGVDIILDFEIGEDQLLFVTSDPGETNETLAAELTQAGEDVELTVNGKTIIFENTDVGDFGAANFLIA
ncbi:MAG: hypothetical protein AAGC81_00340 [Pseudomonadota bacterium]